jgi:hypothetical protein
MSVMAEQQTQSRPRPQSTTPAPLRTQSRMIAASAGRGSFREHRTFWLAALALLMLGVLLIAVTYSLLGLTAAATVMLVELGLALTAGFR